MASNPRLLNLYIILIVVFFLFLFFLGLAVIIFRDALLKFCCKGRGRRSVGAPRDVEGLRNPAFDAHTVEERLATRMPRQQPFRSMEQVEAPPSYEEAVNQELFKFRLPPGVSSIQRPTLNSEEETSQAGGIPPTNLTSSTSSTSSTTQGLPSTSSAPMPTPSLRGGSTLSSSVTSPLSTISEEDSEEGWPVTVVIDCIGIRAARLIEHCDTSVSLTNGSELSSHSKC